MSSLRQEEDKEEVKKIISISENLGKLFRMLKLESLSYALF